MAALSPTSQLALWAFLAQLDRVTKVSFNLFHPDDPLMWALTDLNRVTTTEVEEFLWIRVLDVPRALAARPWAADGTLVLEVDDPLGPAAGRFAVTTADGAATVVRTDDAADVRLTAETLGSLYLAGVPVRLLHRAGRIDGTDDAVGRFAAMADLSEPAYNLTGF
jgi:predicted acetyltransferase